MRDRGRKKSPFPRNSPSVFDFRPRSGTAHAGRGCRPGGCRGGVTPPPSRPRRSRDEAPEASAATGDAPHVAPPLGHASPPRGAASSPRAASSSGGGRRCRRPEGHARGQGALGEIPQARDGNGHHEEWPVSVNVALVVDGCRRRRRYRDYDSTPLIERSLRETPRATRMPLLPKFHRERVHVNTRRLTDAKWRSSEVLPAVIALPTRLDAKFLSRCLNALQRTMRVMFMLNTISQCLALFRRVWQEESDFYQ